MDPSYDPVERLDKDLSIKILMCLDEPTDFAKLCCVSQSWYKFVVENGLLKKFCVNMCPALSVINDYIEVFDEPESLPIRIGREMKGISEFLVREHRMFSYIACIRRHHQIAGSSLCASSFGRIPKEVEDTWDIYITEPAFWCSEGKSDPSLPETIVYQLSFNACLVSEIHVQPYGYQADGNPIYSAKAVRFSLGYLKIPVDPEWNSHYTAAPIYKDDMFIWTYTSPEYPMSQENKVQVFHLPKSVLCVGGMLRMELLGSVQKNPLDGLYYTSVINIQAYGQNLGPVFDIDIKDNLISNVLKCDWGRVYGVEWYREADPDSWYDHVTWYSRVLG